MTPYHHKFTPWRARNGQRVVAAESHWKMPLRWNRAAEKAGERRLVEVTYDVFEDWQGWLLNSKDDRLYRHGDRWVSEYDVPQGVDLERDNCPLEMQDIRARLFAMIDQTPHLTWCLTTAMPDNIGRMMPEYGHYTPAYVSFGEVVGPDWTPAIRPNLVIRLPDGREWREVP